MTSQEFQRISKLSELPDRLRGGVVAIGNFDGVHRGHQAVLRRGLDEAGKRDVPSLVLTFEPHPRTLFQPDVPVFRLTPAPVKAGLLAALGFDAVIEYPFDRGFAALTADQFVAEILQAGLGVSHVVTGFDFHFGRNRQGGPAFLMESAKNNGFGVSLVDAFRDKHAEVISSSWIRRLLEDGNVASAAALLGFRYHVSAEIVRGKQLGRTLGFPTANMVLPGDVMLRHGIYAVRFTLADGTGHNGVASFGRRPTVDDGGGELLETFVFDFSGDIYGQICTVTFIGWLRGEEKFSDVDALVRQMKHDETEARSVLAKTVPLSELDRLVSFDPVNMTARVLITGATSGIGNALTARLSRDSAVLATGSRPEDQVLDLLPAGTRYVQADQARPEEAWKAVDAALEGSGWTDLDLAVLNAGIGFAGEPADETAQTIRQTIDINLMSAVLFAWSLAGRLEQAGGKLVLVGSVAHRGAPGFATYAASKAGLHGFARALREEWRGRISVQVVHPGPTATPMHSRAGFDPGRIGRLFLKPETMAALVHRAIMTERSPVTVSYARYVMSGAFAGRRL